ncbi:Sulfate/thiosulfate import ATP-binding protein CysA [compost metagenome]
MRRNLTYGMKRVPRDQHRVELRQAVDLLGIDHLLERMPRNLSGGERQRVGMARALLTSPKLLLMDEPLAALDLKRKAEILPYLERLHDELDIPILYVSHSPDEVARLADHLVLLEAGRALASGPVGATLARTDLPTSLLEDAGVVIDGHVLGHDEAYGLLSVGLPGTDLGIRLAHAALAQGRALRIKVQARDVSLSLERQTHSSILNVLPATVAEIVDTDNPAHRLVKLDVAGTPLLARITCFSHDQLGLKPGLPVWAQIKSVALLA